MDCGDQSITPNKKSNIVFKPGSNHEFEIYNGNRTEFERRIKNGEIIRCEKHRNNRVAALKMKDKQLRQAEDGGQVLKDVYFLGISGCVFCNDDNGFKFFSHDYDSNLAKMRYKIENPEITDEKLIIKNYKMKKAGSSLDGHIKNCRPEIAEKLNEVTLSNSKVNKSGVKNSGQLQATTVHNLQVKTAAAMMVVSSGLSMEFLNNQHLRNLCDLTAALSEQCLAVAPGDCVWGSDSTKSHIMNKLIPMLDADLKQCAIDSKIIKAGLPLCFNSFSQDVTSTKNHAFLDLSKRTIYLWPEVKFVKDLVSLQQLPKKEDNIYKFDHSGETSAMLNRKKLHEYGFIPTDEMRTSDPITTDRASAARASSEFLTISAACCGAHFESTSFDDAIKFADVPILNKELEKMKNVCRVSNYSSLLIPTYVLVTRQWRAYKRLTVTLIDNKDDITTYVQLHNIADLKKKGKEGKKGEDQVEAPTWAYLVPFRDFLTEWVKHIDRLECHEGLLYEHWITSKLVENLDENQYVINGFSDVKTLILHIKKSYNDKFLKGCIDTSGFFCASMIPSKTTAILLHKTKGHKPTKDNVSAYVQQYIEFTMDDEIVKKRIELTKSYGLTSVNTSKSKAKKTKTIRDEEKAIIVKSKVLEIMEMIDEHIESILESESAPIEDLDFSSADKLPAVADLSMEFVKYWRDYKDARLALIVLKSASALPGSTLSEQAFSKLEFQTTVNQTIETLEARVRLQYAHLNGKVFVFEEN